MLAATGQDLVLDLGWRAARAAVRSARSLAQPSDSLPLVAGEPSVRALTRDGHRPGGVRDRPPLLADALHEQQAAMDGQTGVSVGHEDLRVPG